MLYDYNPEWERGGSVMGGAVMALPAVVDTYDGILATVVALEGAIVRKELEYNGARKIVPATNIPIDTRGLVHIYGRYASPDARQMSIRWTVRDPGGIVRESYYDADTWPYTPPGSEHHFLGGRFNLDKPGNWTIKAELMM